MTPVINEDTNYISRFMYYVRSFHGFNGNAIEKYISREERAVVNVLKKQSSDNAADNAATDNAATDNAATDNAAGNAGQHGWNYSVV